MKLDADLVTCNRLAQLEAVLAERTGSLPVASPWNAELPK
jgi:hypothetical protein